MQVWDLDDEILALQAHLTGGLRLAAHESGWATARGLLIQLCLQPSSHRLIALLCTCIEMHISFHIEMLAKQHLQRANPSRVELKLTCHDIMYFACEPILPRHSP